MAGLQGSKWLLPHGFAASRGAPSRMCALIRLAILAAIFALATGPASLAVAPPSGLKTVSTSEDGALARLAGWVRSAVSDFTWHDPDAQTPPAAPLKYGPFKLQLVIGEPKPETSLWASFMAAVDNAYKVVSTLIFFFAIALLGLIIYRALKAKSVVIEPVGLPQAMKDLGYSEEVATRQLHDALMTISHGADTDKPGDPILPSSRDLELTVPGTGLSLASIVAHVRQLAVFGPPPRRIVSEFVCPRGAFQAKTVVFRFRVSGSKHKHVSIAPAAKRSLEQYFEHAAEQVMRELDPANLASYLLKARREEALTIAGEMMDSNHADRAWAENLIGVDHWQERRFNEAAKWFKKASETNNKTAVFVTNLGVALTAKPDYAAAIDKFKQAIAIDGKHANAYVAWGNALTLKKDYDYDAAIDKFKQAIAIDGKHANAYFAWGAALTKNGKYNEAIEKCEQAIAIDGKHAKAYVQWGNALTGNGKYNEAIEKYKQAIDHDPKFADAHYFLGLAFDHENQADAARDAFNTYVTLNPDGDKAVGARAAIARLQENRSRYRHLR